MLEPVAQEFERDDIFEGVDEDKIQRWYRREVLYASARCRNTTVGNYTKSYENWRRNSNIYRIAQDVLIRKGKTLNILDMGCGNGYHLFAMHHRFGLEACRMTGLDYDELDLAFAEHCKRSMHIKNVAFQQGDVHSVDLPDEHFDLILCSEVVEHLTEPSRCLTEIHRLLKPGGTAIITTPNQDNLMITLGTFLKKLSLRAPSEQSYSTEEGEHISVKGVRVWRELLSNAGLPMRKVLRGSPIWGGGERYNRQRVLFAMMMLADKVLDFCPLGYYISENIVLWAEKPE